MKSFLHVYVVPVVVLVISPHFSRLGQYLHLFLFLQAFLMRLGIVLISIREMVLLGVGSC